MSITPPKRKPSSEDIEAAYLINEVASLIAPNAIRYTAHHRTKKTSYNVLTEALVMVHDDNRFVLPVYKRCLSTEDASVKLDIMLAVVNSLRDLFSVIVLNLPRKHSWQQHAESSLYPTNVLTVLAFWHHSREGNREANIYISSIWLAMIQLIKFGKEHPDDPATASLPELLSWIATHPDTENVKAIVGERGVARRKDIEVLLDESLCIARAIAEGVL